MIVTRDTKSLAARIQSFCKCQIEVQKEDTDVLNPNPHGAPRT